MLRAPGFRFLPLAKLLLPDKIVDGDQRTEGVYGVGPGRNGLRRGIGQCVSAGRRVPSLVEVKPGEPSPLLVATHLLCARISVARRGAKRSLILVGFEDLGELPSDEVGVSEIKPGHASDYLRIQR